MIPLSYHLVRERYLAEVVKEGEAGIFGDAFNEFTRTVTGGAIDAFIKHMKKNNIIFASEQPLTETELPDAL